MRLVQPGDLIFSYVDGAIIAVALANTCAHDSRRPADFGRSADKWAHDGRRVDIAYQRLPQALPLADFVQARS
jgi:hypothetical protein